MIRPSGRDDARIAEAARESLRDFPNGYGYGDRFEGLWSRAGAESLLSGELVFPPIDGLKEVTVPSRAWDVIVWPREALHERIGLVAACHLLAIANDDQPWLAQLDECWRVGDSELGWKELMRGQIQLGRRPGGDPSLEWDEGNIEWFEKEGDLTKDRPADRTWLALSRHDRGEAAVSLAEYRESVFAMEGSRGSFPADQLRRVFRSPEEILRLELLALESLVNRG